MLDQWGGATIVSVLFTGYPHSATHQRNPNFLAHQLIPGADEY